MSNMPETVQAALSALRHLQPANRDDARVVLDLWARRAELSDADATRLLDYYFTGGSNGLLEVADGHVVHTCCGKLDDAEHRNFCEHYRPTPSVADVAPIRHPAWCFLEACTFAAGGVHRSRARTIPGPLSTADGPLVVDLVEARTGGPRVRVWRDGDPWPVQVTLDGARMLARALRDLAMAGGQR